MNHPALTLLMRLLMRGGLRHAWRSVKNPAGAFFVVFMLMMVLFGLGPILASAFADRPPPSTFITELLIGSLPVVMFVMTATLVATNSGDSLLELRPAELQFVLAGPFSDSHILSYRLITLLISWIPLSGFFSLFLLPHFGSFLGGFCGFVLAGSFIMLIVFQFTVIKPKLASVTLKIIRTIAFILIVAIMLETAWSVGAADTKPTPKFMVEAINGGSVAMVCSFPFRSFAAVMASPFGWQLLLHITTSLVFIAIIMTSCYGTNAGFAELAVQGVGRRVKKLQRVKGGNIYGISSKRTNRKQLLPAFPWCAGVGPIAWTQITSALRRTGRIIPVVLILGTIAAIVAAVVLSEFPKTIPPEKRIFALPIALGASFYIGFLVSMTAQTGFTANRRLLTWYQVLPVPPMAISTGMVTGTATPLVLIQMGVCLPAMVINSQSLLASLSVLFAGTSLCFAFATVINTIAGTTHLRPVPHGTPDVFQGAKGMVFMLALGLAMMPVMLFAAGSAGIAWVIFGPSWTACSLVMGGTVFAIQPPLWWYSGEQFVLRELSGD